MYLRNEVAPTPPFESSTIILKLITHSSPPTSFYMHNNNINDFSCHRMCDSKEMDETSSHSLADPKDFEMDEINDDSCESSTSVEVGAPVSLSKEDEQAGLSEVHGKQKDEPLKVRKFSLFSLLLIVIMSDFCV